jgi:hypothetical protein
MAAKDLFHQHVRHALENDGWTITHDPLRLPWGSAPVQIDLGAEKVLAAEKGERKIAVEVKSFLRSSRTEDLEDAMGQLVLYRYLLRRTNTPRELYLAIRQDVYDSFIALSHVTEFLQAEQVKLVIFNPLTEEITQWIEWNNTATS